MTNGNTYWLSDTGHGPPGKLHLIAEDGTKTACGLPLDGNGYKVEDKDYDCGACFTALTRGVRAQPQPGPQYYQPRPTLWQPPDPQLWQANEWIPSGDEWMEAHRQYLRTPEWRDRREEVMEREDELCEACRKRTATEVHHATYKHWRNEPCFELHAVCKPCHDLITMLDRARRRRMTGGY